MRRAYRWRAGLLTRLVDREAFVITRRTIEHLSPVATIAWLLLEQRVTLVDLCATMRSLYPNVDAGRLRKDMRNLLLDLERRKLVRAVNAPAARKAGRQHSTKH